jgi:hypothetical protein
MFFGLAEEEAEAKKRRAYEPKQLQRSWMGV